MNIKELSEKYFSEYARIRRHLHQYPELSGQEFKTQAYIEAELDKLGIPHERMADTGVVALIEGAYPGKTVLLRADIDALPIQEEANVEYKSTVKGVMHACGHDGHTAGVLGAAMILNEMKDQLHGNVKLMFQPAEEAEGGAKRMIEAGILENPKVDAAFGIHLRGQLDQGIVGYKEGAMMASIDEFDIIIKGKGAHAAHPQLGIDPIVIAADTISELQNIVSRKIKANEAAVISVTSIKSVTDAYNVIPQEVALKGTVRTLNQEIRNMIPGLIEKVLEGQAIANESTYTFDLRSDLPVLFNNKETNKIAVKAMEKVIGKENIEELEDASMGGEDFAFVCQEVPTTYLFVGINRDNINPVHHHPAFQWDDSALKISASVLAQCAVDFLNDK